MQSLRSTCPHFSRLGVLSTPVLQYTVQKHEVFNGLLPQCVRIVKGFVMSWKACICIWFGNLFKISNWVWRPLPHLHWKEGDTFIVCQTKELLPCQVGLLVYTACFDRTHMWTCERISQLSWDNCKASLLCLLKNDYDYQEQLPSWKRSISVFWIKNIRILLASFMGITRSFSHKPGLKHWMAVTFGRLNMNTARR